MRPESLLHIAQIEANQSVGEKHRGDPSQPAESVYGRFTDLQHLRQLAGGQILRSLVLRVVRRIGFAGSFVWFVSLRCHLFLHRFE
jgi:hypothetical protein